MSYSSARTIDPARIGLIGLGLIGNAIAQRLAEARLPVLGWDIDPARLVALRDVGGVAASQCEHVFRSCQRVLLSLPSHRQVTDVIESCGSALTEGMVIIDTTTGDPASSESMASILAKRGVIYLDATISGSSAQVRTGAVTLFVGGEAQSFEQSKDILGCIGNPVFHTGPAGSGATMKLVTNLVLGLNRAALAEGLAFAQTLGLDLEKTLVMMKASAAYSRIMDSKGERMIRGNFSPDARLSQHLKDVRLIVEMGQSAGLSMPLSTTHQKVLESAEQHGWGDLDNSAIIKALTLANQKTTTP